MYIDSTAQRPNGRYIYLPSTDISRGALPLACPELFLRPTSRHRTTNQRSDVAFVISIAGARIDYQTPRWSSTALLSSFKHCVSMSDIQQFLLDYDRNKREASQVAQKSATRMLECALSGDGATDGC